MNRQDTTLETAKENQQSAIVKSIVAQSEFTSDSDATRSRLAVSLNLENIQGLSKQGAKGIIKIIKKDVCLNEVLTSGIITVTPKEFEAVIIQLVKPFVLTPSNLAKVVVDASFMKEIKEDDTYRKILKQMVVDVNSEAKSGNSETAEKLLVLLKGDPHSSAKHVNHFLENISTKVLIEEFLSCKEEIDNKIIQELVLDSKFKDKISKYVKNLSSEDYIELCKETYNEGVIQYYDTLNELRPNIDRMVLDHAQFGNDESKGFKLAINHIKEGSNAFQNYVVNSNEFRTDCSKYFDSFNEKYEGEGKNDVLSNLIYLLRILKGDLVDKLLYKNSDGSKKDTSKINEINTIFKQVFDVTNYNRNLKRDIDKLIEELDDELILLASANFKNNFNSVLSDYLNRKKFIGLDLLKFVIKDYVEKDNTELLKFLFNNNYNLGTNEEIGNELKKLVEKSKISSYEKALNIFSKSAGIQELSNSDKYKEGFEKTVKLMLYNQDSHGLKIVLKHLSILLSPEYKAKIDESTKKKVSIDDKYNSQLVPQQSNVHDIEYKPVAIKDFKCQGLESFLTSPDNACKHKTSVLEDEIKKLRDNTKFDEYELKSKHDSQAIELLEKFVNNIDAYSMDMVQPLVTAFAAGCTLFSYGSGILLSTHLTRGLGTQAYGDAISAKGNMFIIGHVCAAVTLAMGATSISTKKGPRTVEEYDKLKLKHESEMNAFQKSLLCKEKGGIWHDVKEGCITAEQLNKYNTCLKIDENTQEICKAENFEL